MLFNKGLFQLLLTNRAPDHIEEQPQNVWLIPYEPFDAEVGQQPSDAMATFLHGDP